MRLIESNPVTATLERMALNVLSQAFNLLQKEGIDKKGGYFCIANAEGVPLFVSLIGGVPQEKAEKYFQYAVEKARRLGQHADHVSSWESRNPEQEQWGGAVRVNADYIVAFSGLPEEWDEAAMLVIADNSFLNSISSRASLYRAILFETRGKNPQFEKLCDYQPPQD